MSDDPITNPDDNPYVSPAIDYVQPLNTESKPAPNQKTAVQSLGILNSTLGDLWALSLGLNLLTSTVLYFNSEDKFFGESMSRPMGAKSFPGSLLVFLLICLIPTVLFLLAGIGIKKRRPWGRNLTLVIATPLAILGVGCLANVVVNIFYADSDYFIVNLILGIIVSALFLVYPIIALNILLRKKYAAEFITQPQPTSKD